MRKSIFVMFFVILIIVLLYVLTKIFNNDIKEDNFHLVSIKYNYSSYNSLYKSISISENTNIMKVIYIDDSIKEFEIDQNFFKELEKIFAKYDVRNWNNYDKNSFEFIDGDNTTIFYEYSDGKEGYILKEEYPKGKDSVFEEIRNYIESQSISRKS